MQLLDPKELASHRMVLSRRWRLGTSSSRVLPKARPPSSSFKSKSRSRSRRRRRPSQLMTARTALHRTRSLCRSCSVGPSRSLRVPANRRQSMSPLPKPIQRLQRRRSPLPNPAQSKLRHRKPSLKRPPPSRKLKHPLLPPQLANSFFPATLIDPVADTSGAGTYRPKS